MKCLRSHYSNHELAMRVVLYLQKQRTRSAKLAAALVQTRFEVSRATAYRLVAHAGMALGWTYLYDMLGRHAPKSSGYPQSYPQKRRT